MRTLAGTVLVLCISATAAAQAPNTDISLRVYGISATRDATLSAVTVGSGSGTMTGGEFATRYAWAGLTLRLVNGDVATASGAAGSGSSLTTAEVRVQLGARVASLDVGYAMRAVTGSLGTTTYSYLRAGASSILDVGATGVSGRLSLGMYFGGQGVPNTTVSGQEIVAALDYRVRGPFFVTLGYRSEVFQATSAGQVRAEHVSGVLVGAGIRYAR